MDVESKSSVDLGVLYDHSLMVAKIRLRTAAEEKKTSETTKRAHCYLIDKLKDA